MQCGMEAEAAKLGVSVKTQGAQKFDPTLQKPILGLSCRWQTGRHFDRTHGRDGDAGASQRSG